MTLICPILLTHVLNMWANSLPRPFSTLLSGAILFNPKWILLIFKIKFTKFLDVHLIFNFRIAVKGFFQKVLNLIRKLMVHFRFCSCYLCYFGHTLPVSLTWKIYGFRDNYWYNIVWKKMFGIVKTLTIIL